MSTQIRFPGELANNSPSFALIDEDAVRGGYRNVNTVAERDFIPADKRKLGALVGISTGDSQGLWRYVGTDLIDSNWSLLANWVQTGKPLKSFTRIGDNTLRIDYGDGLQFDVTDVPKLGADGKVITSQLPAIVGQVHVFEFTTDVEYAINTEGITIYEGSYIHIYNYPDDNSGLWLAVNNLTSPFSWETAKTNGDIIDVADAKEGYTKAEIDSAFSKQKFTAGDGMSGGGDLSTGGQTITYKVEVDGVSVVINNDKKIQHGNTSDAPSLEAADNQFVNSITLDDYGHITAITTGTISSNGVNLANDINVTLNVGGYKKGDTITAGTSIETAFRGLLSPYVSSSLNRPSVKMAPNNSSFRVGDSATVESITFSTNADSNGDKPVDLVLNGPGFNQQSVTTSPATPGDSGSVTVTKTSKTSASWTFNGKNAQGVQLSQQSTSKSWVYSVHFGASTKTVENGSSDIIASDLINSLGYNLLSSGAVTKTCGPDHDKDLYYTYYAIPESYDGNLVIDLNGALDVRDAFTRFGVFNYTYAVSSGTFTVRYVIYKSNSDKAYAEGTSLTFRFK